MKSKKNSNTKRSGVAVDALVRPSWYSEALEVLSPLRWHINELIDAMESHNRFAQRLGLPLLPDAKIAAAKAANEAVDSFFQPNDKREVLCKHEWPNAGCSTGG